MKFWKKLFGAVPSADADGAAAELAYARERAAAGQAFDALIELLTSALAQDEAQRIREVARAAWQARAAEDAAAGSFARVDAYPVLEEVMAGEQGQRPGQWLIIHIDWRASDEIGWQVADILASRQVQAAWKGAEVEFDTPPAAFAALAQWLRDRGLALLHIETDADAYCAIIVAAAEAGRARSAAEAAGLTVYDPGEFAERS